MSSLLTTTSMPLLFLIPVWFFLIQSGTLIKSVNKRKYGKRQLILIDAIDSIRWPLVLVTFVQYLRHCIAQVDSSNEFVNVVIEHHVYFLITLFLCSHLILRFSESVRRDLIAMYTQEELRFSDLSRSLEKTKVDATAKIVKGLWIVVSGLIVLDHFGVPAGSILAVGGMGSLIIGFAAKDILSDIMSGLLLYLDRQFSIGDWIKIEQPMLEGTVESIGWRVSKIKTLDNRPMYVPNKFLGAAVIQNVSRRESMRFKEYLTIDLESIGKVNEVCNCIRESILINHDDIDVSQPVVVNVTDLNGAVINIYISAFTNSVDVVDFYNIKQDIWLKIVQVLEDHDAKICTSFEKELMLLRR